MHNIGAVITAVMADALLKDTASQLLSLCKFVTYKLGGLITPLKIARPGGATFTACIYKILSVMQQL